MASIACEECEKASAIWRCNECQQSMCGICDANIHAKAARKTHKRVPFSQPTMKAIAPEVTTVRLAMPIKPATVAEAAASLPVSRAGDRTSAYLFEDPDRDQQSQLAALDNMFNDLKTDMVNIGSKQEIAKLCAGCNKELHTGESFITAAGRRFHPACFRCSHCNKELRDSAHVEHLGKVYCPADHKQLFSNKCYVCGQYVKDKIVKAHGRIYHAEHFTCFHCKKQLQGNYVEHEGQLYCPEDHAELFAKRCAICKRPITGPFISTEGRHIHAECFACQTCRKPLINNKAFNLGGLPYCEQHFHEVTNTLCAKCNQPVNGTAIQAYGRTYHTNCFACTRCGVVLSNSYYEKNNQPYCEAHKP